MLWVLGHSNIEGNEEKANKLAKQAATIEYIGPEPVLADLSFDWPEYP